ncbi:hypothetical protein PC9H_005313 [Pleurotus ostreatus]|uniref:F-box domain-containing protein n=1 Tax=Pleurotus ostreatus TaxID=5322 RepID=A0A8H7A090_PLEOS|nr:uncharacterized protein PC9H_005313 [Pleurotus ostreatus]KAF7433363.1 hypothetical protein PC9H_005313 [Pleurotus ostreatus]KAJ8697955.1 hypothetical protein PTI98_004722 [Pleurotus ostreatus]
MAHTLQEFYDDQIDACPADVRMLCERRNADCSQTRKLPPEVLIEIFAILGSFNYGRHCLYPHLKWVSVTQVCRTWRNIALNEPLLWTDFVNRVHSNWAPEIFARSKAAPLRVCLGEFNGTPDFIIDELVKSPERIKELEIDAYGGAALVRRLVKPAPILESLVITSDTGVEFPPNFLGGVAPRLRSVRCWVLPAEADWLANLRSLNHSGLLPTHASWLSKLTSLHLGRYATQLSKSVDGMFSILENAPLLHQLTFTTSSHMGDAPRTRSTPLRLRYLCDITAYLEAKPGMAIIFDQLQVDNIERLRTFWPRRFEDSTMLEHVRNFFDRCYHGDTLQYSAHELEKRRYICWTEPGQEFQDRTRKSYTRY